MDKEKRLIANRWQTPDGTILWSRYTHDSVNYIDENGIRYMVDGGNDYCHLSDNKEQPLKNCCIFNDEPWNIQREYILRGTFDKNNGDRIWVPLSKLSDEHLQNIINDLLDYFSKQDNAVENVYTKEQDYRKENNIIVEEHDYFMEAIQPIKPTSDRVCPRCGSRRFKK